MWWFSPLRKAVTGSICFFNHSIFCLSLWTWMDQETMNGYSHWGRGQGDTPVLHWTSCVHKEASGGVCRTQRQMEEEDGDCFGSWVNRDISKESLVPSCVYVFAIPFHLNGLELQWDQSSGLGSTTTTVCFKSCFKIFCCCCDWSFIGNFFHISLWDVFWLCAQVNLPYSPYRVLSLDDSCPP